MKFQDDISIPDTYIHTTFFKVGGIIIRMGYIFMSNYINEYV